MPIIGWSNAGTSAIWRRSFPIRSLSLRDSIHPGSIPIACDESVPRIRKQARLSCFWRISLNRWQIELFFKALKQQLKVKSFVGTSRNALLSQLWVALIAYLLLSYLKFRSRFAWSLYTLSAILPTNLFSKRNLWDWLNAPFQPKSQSPPLVPQLRLSFG